MTDEVTFTVTVQELFTGMLPPARETLPDPAFAVAVPPQELVRPLGVATTRFAGKLSVNATPAAGSGLAAGLVMVMVRVLTPFGWMPAGLKPLAITGGPSTFSGAVLLVPPVPPSVEVMTPVVLFCVPAAVPFTVTEKLHEPLAPKLPPDNVTLEGGPITAVMAPLPQDPVTVVEVNCRPAGRLSAKPMPDRGTPLGLLTVKVRVVVATFRATLLAPKPLVTVGGPTTVMVAFAVVLCPPSNEVAKTLLFFTPATVPCTFTETAQDAPAASVPPARLAEGAPATGLKVPLQVLLPLGVGATTKPAGRLSVKASWVKATLLLGLAMLKVRVLMPFRGICVGLNPFVIDGG